LNLRHALVLLMVLVGACFPFTMSSGQLGSAVSPFRYVSAYSFWDVKVRVPEGDEVRWEDREEAAGGSIINVFLAGFAFNPNDDRGQWTAGQWSSFQNDYLQSPWLNFTITNAEKLKAGDKLVWDNASDATDAGFFFFDAGFPNNDRNPSLGTFNMYDGTARLDNTSEFPDTEVGYGSRRDLEIEFKNVAETPGLGAVISGTLTYKIEKTDGDSGDAQEGEIVVNFSAPLLGERFAKCNEYWTAFNLYGIYASYYSEYSAACTRLDVTNE